jgi:hypothetical protein
MIQQVPTVLLYNMIYISKKEEFLIIIKPCQKASHGAQFGVYCWKQSQRAREG